MTRTHSRLFGLLLATLLVPWSVSAESDTDRAKREMDAFCKMASLYCAKLSKKDKAAMLKRFHDGEAYRTTYPAPNVDTTPRDKDGWPIPSTVGEAIATECLRAAHANPYGTVTAEEARRITACTVGMGNTLRAR